MSISWSDTEQIEAYLDEKLCPADRKAFLERIAFDEGFRRNVNAQRAVRVLLRQHHFSRLKNAAATLHSRLYRSAERRQMTMAIDALFSMQE